MSYPEGGAALERVLRLLKLVKVEDFKVGFERLRQAKLEQADEDVYPYKYSAFETRRMQPDGVLPSSYYVLTARLSFQEALRVRLNEIGIDLFNLPGIVYFEVGDKLRGLVPPIIEVYPEPEFSGQTVASLQDGLHRMFMAKTIGGVPQTYIVIENADRRYLPYAIPNSWDEVHVYENVPFLKKRFRQVDKPYSNMRPLCSLFDPDMDVVWADYGRAPGSH